MSRRKFNYPTVLQKVSKACIAWHNDVAKKKNNTTLKFYKSLDIYESLEIRESFEISESFKTLKYLRFKNLFFNVSKLSYL